MRGDGGMTRVTTVATLFAGRESDTVEVSVAVLVTNPAAVGPTVTRMVPT